jgi:hypothetical protein
MRATTSISRWGARVGSWALTLGFVAYGWLLFFYPLEKVLVLTKILLGV